MRSSLLQNWLRLQALIWLPLLVACGLEFGAIPWLVWPVVIGLSFLAVVAILRAIRTAADFVTIARILGLLIVAYSAPSDVPLAAWLSILGLVLLDLVDGVLARRFGATWQGAILDMEADQLAMLLLALLLYRDGASAHVLLVPAIRYFYIVVMWLLRIPAHDPKPMGGDNRRGRLCCALVMTALLAALWPGMPLPASDVLTAVAVVVLAFSFGSDARFLVSRMREARAA